LLQKIQRQINAGHAAFGDLFSALLPLHVTGKKRFRAPQFSIDRVRAKPTRPNNCRVRFSSFDG
jgi:hypothetical protein